ncbi:hypothetical protein [Streptomyces sp. CB01881]|uniref:hypothetical protein n=1 Tax=Streptomyces sp. CB01881 TaxID=2078691 RepID=UPI001F11A6DC|nr:hypothetical protein [Streptomyces sp. CB01881]
MRDRGPVEGGGQGREGTRVSEPGEGLDQAPAVRPGVGAAVVPGVGDRGQAVGDGVGRGGGEAEEVWQDGEDGLAEGRVGVGEPAAEQGDQLAEGATHLAEQPAGLPAAAAARCRASCGELFGAERRPFGGAVSEGVVDDPQGDVGRVAVLVGGDAAQQADGGGEGVGGRRAGGEPGEGTEAQGRGLVRVVGQGGEPGGDGPGEAGEAPGECRGRGGEGGPDLGVGFVRQPPAQQREGGGPVGVQAGERAGCGAAHARVGVGEKGREGVGARGHGFPAPGEEGPPGGLVRALRRLLADQVVAGLADAGEQFDHRPAVRQAPVGDQFEEEGQAGEGGVADVALVVDGAVQVVQRLLTGGRAGGGQAEQHRGHVVGGAVGVPEGRPVDLMQCVEHARPPRWSLPGQSAPPH